MMKTVIFDLGGVVFDWNPEKITTMFLDSIEAPEDERDALAATLKREVFQHPDWLETDRGTLNEIDAAHRFASRTGCSANEMAQLLTITSASLEPFPETLLLIDELAQRGIPLYVLSNMPSERGTYLLKAFDFWDRFTGIILSGNIQLIKPDAAIFEYLLTKFNLKATECAFLDDSMPNIVAANGLGIHGIHFQHASPCRPQIEDWLMK